MKIIYKEILIIFVVLLLGMEGHAQPYIYGSEIDNWTEDIKEQQRENGHEFIRQLHEAKAKGLTEINLTHAHYRFKRGHSKGRVGHIFAEGLENLVINGNGAEFWFEDYHTALFFRNCKNVTLNNLSFDYDPVPQAQGAVVNIGDYYLDIENEKGFPTCTEIGAKAGKTKSKAFVFDPKTNLFKRDVHHIVVNKFEDLENNITRIHTKTTGYYKLNGIPNIEKGDRVCVNFHMGHGIIFESCNNITLDHFSLYASTQYGIVSRFGGGFKMINSNIIQRPGTSRLMTTNQDGIHFQSNETGPHIENCNLSGMSDDVINVHGDFDMIQRQLAPGKALISIRNYMLLEAGDTINIYDVDTYVKKASVTIIDITESENVNDKLDAKALGKEFNAHFWPGKYSMIVTFDKEVDLKRGDVVENPAKGSYGTYIANNRVYNSSTRGFMIKVRDAVVEGNRMENIAVSGILTFGSLEWYDAIFPQNITIRNNTLTGIGHSLNSRRPGQKKLGAICAMVEYYGPLKEGIYNAKNIVIENNYIEDTPLAGIFVVHVDGAIIKGNTIKKYNVGKKYRMGEDLGVQPFAGIYIADSKNIVLKENLIRKPGRNAIDKVLYGPHYIGNK